MMDLRTRREALGLSQRDLANLAGVVQPTIVNAEADRPLRRAPRRVIELALTEAENDNDPDKPGR